MRSSTGGSGSSPGPPAPAAPGAPRLSGPGALGGEGALLGGEPGELGGLRGGGLLVAAGEFPHGAQGQPARPVDQRGPPRTRQPHGFQQALVDSLHRGSPPAWGSAE